ELIENAERIFGGIVRQLNALNIGDGGQHIRKIDHAGILRSFFYMAGPFDDKWLTMPAFPKIALEAAPLAGRIMLELLGEAHSDAGRAVIAGENDHGVVIELEIGESLQNLADGIIGLLDKIAVGADFAFA